MTEHWQTVTELWHWIVVTAIPTAMLAIAGVAAVWIKGYKDRITAKFEVEKRRTEHESELERIRAEGDIAAEKARIETEAETEKVRLEEVKLLRKSVAELTTETLKQNTEIIRLTRDGADCRQNEEKLKARVAVLEQKVGVTPLPPMGGVMQIGAGRDIHMFSPSLQALLGWAPRDVWDQKLDYIFPPDALSVIEPMLKRIEAKEAIDLTWKADVNANTKAGSLVPVMVQVEDHLFADHGLINVFLTQRTETGK